MDAEKLSEITARIDACAKSAVRTLAFEQDWQSGLLRQVEAVHSTQRLLQDEFTTVRDETVFWEELWTRTWHVRRQWEKMQRAAARRGPAAAALIKKNLDRCCKELYCWSRLFATEKAPRKPSASHFQLGIDRSRPDCRELHERIEGLYESIKRQGAFPAVRQNVDTPPGKNVNFAIIYGGGWNVSAYSVMRAAADAGDMFVLVAFDHQGNSLFRKSGRRSVRVAPAGLMLDPQGRYALSSFRKPPVLHFVCPHEWSGQAPHEIGVPVLRSDLTLRYVDNKHLTTRALLEYRKNAGFRFNLIDEEFLPCPDFPADMDALARRAEKAVESLQQRGVSEIVVKPTRGEEGRDTEFFKIPSETGAAVCHGIETALNGGALMQERIMPGGGIDYNWRVFVAALPGGEPEIAGRFARVVHGDSVEMTAGDDMIERAGMTREEGQSLLKRIDTAALHAFRAVSRYSQLHMQDFPAAPLGGAGSYAIPYFLGIDLIGDARIMEINGNEVAGMWTDDRLYPETAGRTSRSVLRSARLAAGAYREALEAGVNTDSKGFFE